MKCCICHEERPAGEMVMLVTARVVTTGGGVARPSELATIPEENLCTCSPDCTRKMMDNYEAFEKACEKLGVPPDSVTPEAHEPGSIDLSSYETEN